MMSRQRQQTNATTRVKGWQQRSLFTHAELRPYRKNRWKYRQRKEKAHADAP